MKLLYVHEVLLSTIHREYLVGLLTADNRRLPPIIADHPKMYMKIRVLLLLFPLLPLFSSVFFCYLYFFRIFYI